MGYRGMVRRWGFVDEDVFAPLARVLNTAGVRPSHFTLLQAPVYVLQLHFGLRGDVGAFFWLVVAGIVLDGADGIMARLTGRVTATGAALDGAADAVGIGVVLVVAGVLHPAAVVSCWILAGENAAIAIANRRRRQKTIPFTRGPLTLGVVLAPRFAPAFGAGLLAPLLAGTYVLGRALMRKAAHEHVKRSAPRQVVHLLSGRTIPKP